MGWFANQKLANEKKKKAKAAAKQSLKDLESYCNGRPDQIAHCDVVHLFPDCLVLLRKGDPAWAGISGVSATVQAEGSLSVSSCATLTRSLTPLTGWQKKTVVDTRATFLVIDGPEFEWVVEVPDQPILSDSPLAHAFGIPGGMDAHQFAAAVTTAARKSAGAA